MYCLNDSLVLREGFECFIQEINKILFINPLLCLSLPSLSMKIFLRDYYNFHTGPIENCSGNIELFIRESYKGGVADVFKPYMKNGYHYDINSLYPYVMKEFNYPVGRGRWVKSKEIDLDTFFGFLEVEVYCPTTVKVPLLTKYDSIKGLICPVGTWKGIYFSEELKVAKSLGYTFKITRGVFYEKKKIFISIINNFYNLRCKYTKNSPGNIILKLLMNSLYGRFGMRPKRPETQIVNKKKYNEIQSIYSVLSVTSLNKKFVIVFIKTPVLKKVDLLYKFNLITADRYNTLRKKSLYHSRFTPVQVASAITSYGRIIIHKYKSDLNNEVYYSDTDSIFCKYPIHKRYLSDAKLGFMKKCGKVREAYFIVPKLYACLYLNKFDIKSKGINKGLVSFQDIKNFYSGKEATFINTLFFKKDYKNFIIKKTKQKINLSGEYLKRKKIYTNGVWTSTTPHIF